MIGVASWSSSRPTPTPVRMSGSARTTTYVSAAVTRTARVARTTTAMAGAGRAWSAGGRRGDLDIGPEVAELEGEGGVLVGAEERSGQLRPAQLTAVGGDGEDALHRLARVGAGEDLLDQVAGDLRRHLLDDLALYPLLLPQLRRLGLREEL